MPKTTNIFARVEPEVKAQAEAILEQLGIPMSNAIGLFLRQIVLKRGIPFDMKLPQRQPLSLADVTAEQLDTELQKGFDSMHTGRVLSAEQVRAEMQRRYHK